MIPAKFQVRRCLSLGATAFQSLSLQIRVRPQLWPSLNRRRMIRIDLIFFQVKQAMLNNACAKFQLAKIRISNVLDSKTCFQSLPGGGSE